MNTRDLLRAINRVHTDNPHVADALTLMRLVVKNNPKKSAAEILARPDVAAAVGHLDGWISAAREAAAAVVNEVPAAEHLIGPDATRTLDRLNADTRIEGRIGEWRDSDERAEDWAAKIVLRMHWFLDWLLKMTDYALLQAPYKRWESRLDPKTCRFCRGLHGVVLPLAESFALEASRIGYTRIYGGLFAPPLHPRCRCRLVPVSQAQYDQLTLARAS